MNLPTGCFAAIIMRGEWTGGQYSFRGYELVNLVEKTDEKKAIKEADSVVVALQWKHRGDEVKKTYALMKVVKVVHSLNPPSYIIR